MSQLNLGSQDILTAILHTKAEEVNRKSQSKSLDVIRAEAMACEFPIRPFRDVMHNRIVAGQPAVIAELKKASPSKGVIRDNFNLFFLARAYEKGHATCLSVLTDYQYFQGHDTFLAEVRESVDLPLLRKDFIIHEYQIYESRLLGADAILLIAAAMSVAQLNALSQLARSLGLDVLIEVHSLEEHQSVVHLADDCLIGVNNRNLRTFEVDTQITLDIHQAIQPQHWCITESGISERSQIELMMDNGIFGFLIGEAFMRYENPIDGIQALLPELFRPPS